jgi:hypothetical protein
LEASRTAPIAPEPSRREDTLIVSPPPSSFFFFFFLILGFFYFAFILFFIFRFFLTEPPFAGRLEKLKCLYEDWWLLCPIYLRQFGEFFTAFVLASEHVFVFLMGTYGALVIPYVLASSPVVHIEAKGPTDLVVFAFFFWVPARNSFSFCGGGELSYPHPLSP